MAFKRRIDRFHVDVRGEQLYNQWREKEEYRQWKKSLLQLPEAARGEGTYLQRVTSPATHIVVSFYSIELERCQSWIESLEKKSLEEDESSDEEKSFGEDDSQCWSQAVPSFA
jgi:hypothetical protein